jgi:hypothetical protein
MKRGTLRGSNLWLIDASGWSAIVCFLRVPRNIGIEPTLNEPIELSMDLTPDIE